MISDLILRVTHNGTTADLPVNNSVPLRLDMSAVENQNIGGVFGIGSQTFDLPGTKEVNRFFNHAYDVAQDDIPGMYSTLPCSVILNGETLLKGKVQLLEVVTSEDGFVTYKVQVNDSVIDFSNALGNKLITNANFDAYNHTLSSGSILSSWITPIGGGVFYPLADYGADSTSVYPTQPYFQVSGNGVQGYIDSQYSPIQVQQLLPAIKASAVIDAIFEQAGFSYTSSFLSNNDFGNMYILPRAKEDLGIVGTVFNNNLYATGSGTTALQILESPLGGNDSDYAAFNQEILDPGNNYNTTTYTYTAPAKGVYGIDVLLSCSIDTGQFIDGVLSLTVGSGNVSKELLQAATYEDTISYQGTITLNKGQTLRVEVAIGCAGPMNGDITVDVDLQNSYFKIPQAVSIYDGAPVIMANQFDSSTKSIDLLKGFLEQFNLIMVPEPNQSKVLRIEPFDQWMRNGEVKDWTSKYDAAKRIAINHTVDEQPKQILFQNAQDSDRFSKVAQESAPNFQYGSLRVLSDSDVTQGEKELAKYFAPTVLGSICRPLSTFPNDTFVLSDSTFVFPHLYKFENAERTSFKFKPRIGYRVTGLEPVGAANGQIWVGNSGSAEPATSYATLSNVDSLPVVSGTKDLLFNNSYTTFVPAELNMSGSTTNFTEHWETYVESLYWEGAKKVTLDIQFEPYEFKSIALNDKILIKNQAYRINKISGFNVTRRDIATVELIKLYPEYWSSEPIPYPGPGPEPTPTLYGPFQITALQGDGQANSANACALNVSWPFYSNKSSVADITYNDIIYSNSSGDLWYGEAEWYGIGTGIGASSDKAIQITNYGLVVGLAVCP